MPGCCTTPRRPRTRSTSWAAQLDEVMFVVRGSRRPAQRHDRRVPSRDKRVEVLRSIFPALQPAIDGALAVMVEQENFDLLPAVVEAYDRVAEERRNIVVADVTTAIPLTESLRQSISDKLSCRHGSHRRPSREGRPVPSSAASVSTPRGAGSTRASSRSSRTPAPFCPRTHSLEVVLRWRTSPPRASTQYSGLSWRL